MKMNYKHFRAKPTTQPQTSTAMTSLLQLEVAGSSVCAEGVEIKSPKSVIGPTVFD